MFAIDAKAITCTPISPDCPPASTIVTDVISIQITIHDQTITCNYTFCYCYKCPDPNIPNDPLRISVWNIEATNGCGLEGLGLVYDKIKELLTDGNHIQSDCGDLPPCLGPPPNYRYVEYSVAACWHAVNENNLVYFRPCPLCTAKCITVYRFCVNEGFVYQELVSNTLVGDLDCSPTCPYYGFGPGDAVITWPYVPGTESECYHVCE